MQRVCKRRGIIPLRFRAHDRNRGKETFPESRLEPSELGIWSSFAAVVQSEVDTEWILVLEDDAVLLPGFRRRVIKIIDDVSANVVSVRLGWLGQFAWRPQISLVRYLARLVKSIVTRWTVVVASRLRGRSLAEEHGVALHRYGAHAVLVRARAVPTMLSTFGPAEVPIDVALIRAERAAPDLYTLSRRNLAWQWPSRSDIAQDRVNKAIRLKSDRA